MASYYQVGGDVEDGWNGPSKRTLDPSYEFAVRFAGPKACRYGCVHHLIPHNPRHTLVSPSFVERLCLCWLDAAQEQQVRLGFVRKVFGELVGPGVGES